MSDKPSIHDLFDLNSLRRPSFSSPEDFDQYQRECEALFVDLFQNRMTPLLKKHDATIRHLDILICVISYGLFRTTLFQTDPEIEDERFTRENYRNAIADYYENMSAVMSRILDERNKNEARIQRETKGKF